ncbi:MULTISPECIES: penicillin-binding transpeptidase domain-containing protein [Helcococcus]|uniref:Penicillin-binding transpeptidase domain-containing protein n=1 Tax=Helcococcus bovis TaxID=3153252 RepID=A0ABW9F6N9_9FIRM
MKKSRLRIVFVVFLIAFLILISRLFELTVINGAKYKKFSDNNRIKQINLDSTRGIIYDRNGIALADNKPIYSLVAYKDRFSSLSDTDKKNTLLEVTKFLENEGINFANNSKFGIYEFMYKEKNDYFKEKTLPDEKVIKAIQDKKILEKIFLSSYKYDDNKIIFYPIKRMRDYINLRGTQMPLKLKFENNKIEIEFEKNEQYDRLLKNKEITDSTKPIDYFIDKVINDDSFLDYLISHPLSRKIIYDVLKENKKESNIILSDIVFNLDRNFIEEKARLNKVSPKITLTSDAKSDFLNLVKDLSIKKLLETAYSDKDQLVIPASKLIILLEKNGIKTNIKFNINEEKKKVELYYAEDSHNINSNLTPVDALIKYAKDSNLLDNFIISDDIIYYAQSSIFESGIYPKIYLKDWQYSYIKDKEDLIDGERKDISAKEFFEKYSKEFNLDFNDVYLKYSTLSILEKINSRGYLAYAPIEIAKNLNKNSIVQIEERIPKDSGFEIILESNRNYPFRNTASHMLGYIGKISSEKEIDEYVEYKKYDLNDIIGKYGLEESFEDTLRGSKGKRLVYTDVYGKTTDVIEETKSVPGNNLYTSIDINLQRQTEKIIEDLLYSVNTGANYQSYFGQYGITAAPKAKIASAVVIDTKTGQVLSMVSKPDYDPNLFVNGISNYAWDKLNNLDPNDIYAPRPILNNVVQSAFIPGSTFKTVVSLTALEKGLDPNDPIYTGGYIEVGDNRFYELLFSQTGGTWGNLNLYDALKVSSNFYFYVLGLGYNPEKQNDVNVQVTLDDINNMTKKLGLQNPTGIEINYPIESGGTSPSIEGKRNIVRIQLRYYLENNLQKYSKKDVKVNDIKLKNDINTIISWVDKGADNSRDDIIKNLESMGYEAEKIIEGQNDNLADRIKYTYLNLAVWTTSDSLNMVIGQGQNSYTPMQMAQLASIIANDGKLMHPTLINKIENYDNSKLIFSQTPKSKDTGININSFKAVKEGMRRASTDVLYRDNFPFEIGSKTGTAQLGSIDPKTGKSYEDLVSEISFGPLNTPEIAVYVSVVEGGKSTNVRGAVNDIYYAYYKYVKKDPAFTNTRPGELEEIKK